MGKNLKIFLGISYMLILISFLYFIFVSIDINRLNDFSYYKEIQSSLIEYISLNIMINIFYFFIFAVIWVSLLGFGSPILIVSGILFGKWIGTLVSVVSISVGALVLYSIGNFSSEPDKKSVKKIWDIFNFSGKMNFTTFYL